MFREATVKDIDNYMIVRLAVRENMLNNHALILLCQVKKRGEESTLDSTECLSSPL